MVKMVNEVRALASGGSNAKYSAFGTSNTKKPLLSGVLNAKIFGMDEQCNLKFESVLFMNCKTFIIFLFAVGLDKCGKFVFFLFLINSSLFPLSSHTSEALSPVYLCLFLFTLILFLSHPQSTPLTSSHCRANDLTWSCLAWSCRSHLELSRLKSPILLGAANFAWNCWSRLEPPCLESSTSSLSTSLISLSLGACGNVCNNGWLILVVVSWLILVSSNGL